MYSTLSMAALAAAGSIALVWASASGARLPLPYSARPSQRLAWQQAFPTAGKGEGGATAFLRLFADAFALRRYEAVQLHPDDVILELYRALYPGKLMTRADEIDTLAEALRASCGIELDMVWSEQLSLGQLYGEVRLGRRQLDLAGPPA